MAPKNLNFRMTIPEEFRNKWALFNNRAKVEEVTTAELLKDLIEDYLEEFGDEVEAPDSNVKDANSPKKRIIKKALPAKKKAFVSKKVSITIKRDDLEKSMEILKNNKKVLAKDISFKKNVSKISIVGAGMVTTPGVTYKMFRALADERVNILAISTSEIKISVIIEEEFTLKAVKKLHSIFNLD